MKAHIKNESDPLAGTVVQDGPRRGSYAWYEAMYRRLETEHEIALATLATQDARLAKTGADLEECKKLASGLITDIGVEREARAVAERIASERAAEVQRLETRVLELEPLAEAGRRMEAMPPGDISIERTEEGEWFVGTDRGIEGGYVPLHEALRAAGIGEAP